MTSVTHNSASGLALERLLTELTQQLGNMGLTVWAYDPAGEAVHQPAPREEFCHHLCGRSAAMADARSALARQVCEQGQAADTLAPTGCCLLAVPVSQRRRQSGAAVACFPSLQTCQSEEFHRSCTQLQLDAQAMTAMAGRIARHPAGEAALLARTLGWLIQDEQARQSSRDELAKLSNNLSSTYEELSLLYRISGMVKVTRSSAEFFQSLCGELLEVMQLEAAAAVIFPRDRAGSAERVVIAGQLPLAPERVARIVREVLLSRLAEPAKPLVENQFAQLPGSERSGIKRLLAVPLLAADNTLKGMLLGLNKLSGEFDSVDLKLISSIGGQAGVFLENHHLYEDLQDMLMGLLHALTASIDAKDRYTCGHSRRVALLSRKLAELAGFEPRRVERIYLAGLLHDVGKIGMPEAVLCKPGKLTDAEFDSVKRHPLVGAGILGNVRQLDDVVEVVLHHHERIDGRGYPDHLAGEQIPIEARIVGLADSFDAMTSCRTYRGAMPLAYVTAEIRRCSGTQFDNRLADLLLSLDLESFLAELRAATAAEPAKGEAA